MISLSLTMLIGAFFGSEVKAQENTSAIQFHGSNVLSGQLSSRQGSNSTVPKEFFRNDLQMTLTAYDIPIATSFFITNDQPDYKQSIDNLRVYIDLNALKRNKSRVEARNKTTGKKVPWMLRFLSNFSKIEAGRFRPDYGELTLSGIPVSGVNIEFTHKVVYAAFASGQTKKATTGQSDFNTTLKQKLLFGKFGFGEKQRTHFYLSYMHVEDEAPDNTWDEQNGFAEPTPQSNDILSADLRLSFFKNKWVIDGEAGLSMLTRNTQYPITYDSVLYYTDTSSQVNNSIKFTSDSTFQEETPFTDKVPPFIIDATNPNITSSYDAAYGVKTKLSLRTTTVSGAYKAVRPGYYSLGNPNLINDRQTIEGRIDQALFSRKVSISAFFKQFKDNLIEWKNKTSTSTSWGLSARFAIRKAPYFQISYAPNTQETVDSITSTFNYLNVLSASTGYNYRLGGYKSFTSLSYFYQGSDYEGNTFFSYSNTHTVTLNQALTFIFPLRVNFNASYSDLASTDFYRNIFSMGLSAKHHAFNKKWENKLGGKYMSSYEESDENEYNKNKFSLYWKTRIKLWKKGELSLTFEENIFNNIESDIESYNEFIARCNFTVRW